MLTSQLILLGLIDGAGGTVVPPEPPAEETRGGGYASGMRRVRLPDGSETIVHESEIPALIARIERQAENPQERRAAVRASLELSKAQPVLDLDAPWARELVARALAEYMLERELIRQRQQRADDDALILLLM